MSVQPAHSGIISAIKFILSCLLYLICVADMKSDKKWVARGSSLTGTPSRGSVEASTDAQPVQIGKTISMYI